MLEGFSLHADTAVHGHDRQGLERLCRYGARGTDVLQCPCGGRRTIRSLHSTRKQSEARLAELGHPLPSRVLPPTTAPPQLLLAM